MQNKTQAATYYDIAELFGRAYIKSQRADLAINGFRATGIYPIDRSVFQDYDFIHIEPSSEIHAISVQSQQADTLQIQSTLLTPEDNIEDDDSDRTFVDETELNEAMVSIPHSSGYHKISVACENTTKAVC